MYLSKSFSALVAMAALAGCDTDGDPNSKTVYINVPAMTISGSFSLNGGSFPASQYEHGIISLADSNGNEAQLGKTYSVSYQTEVVAGNYRTQYRHIYGGAQVPVNRSKEIETGFSLLEDQSLDINATAFQAQFTFTLNGAPFPVSEYDDALFYLQPQDGSERILLGNSHAVIPPVLLMPGDYDVIYTLETPGATVPLNQNAIVGQVAMTDSAVNVTLDVKATDFRLSATLDGVAFPVSQYNDGNFLLVSSTQDTVELGDSYNLPFSVRVIEGTYDLIYRHETGTAVPANTEAIILSGQEISQSTPTAEPNIPSILITPIYTLDGLPFPISEYQDANIYLRGTNQHDLFFIGNTHDPDPAAVRIIPGTYDVIYRHETGSSVPQNTNAVVMQATVLNSSGQLAIAVQSAIATATFSLNDASFTTNPVHYGRFFLEGPEEGDTIFLGNSYNGSGTVRVIPATYDVIYEHVTGSQVPGNKHATILSDVDVNDTTALPVNLEATQINPSFTLNGFPFPATLDEHALFVMHTTDIDNEVVLGRSFLPPTTLFALNGSYEVFYEYIDGATIPVNDRAKIRNLTLP